MFGFPACCLLIACLTFAERHAELMPAIRVVRIQVARPGHAAAVTSVAFAPDGEMLASASFDEALSLWDVATGKELRRIIGHPKLVSTAFCPDGRTLASAGWDGTIRLWQVADGQQLHQWPSSGDRVFSVAFSPDGRFLASGEPNCTLSLWELATSKKVRQFEARSNGTYALAFSPDRKLLASSSFVDQAVQIWEVATGAPVRRLGDPETSLCAFCFSPDGKSLVSGGRQGQLSLWEVATAGERLRFGGRQSTVQCLAFSPDGETVVSGHDNGLLCVWDAATGKERCRLQGHGERVRSVAFAPTGSLVASGSEDMTILLWRVKVSPRQQRARGLLPGPKDLATLWDDLARNDASQAYRAVLALTAIPDQSVDFLRQQVQLSGGVEERIARLVVDLDDNRFAVRRKASSELEKFGRQAEAALRAQLAARPSLEVRRRIEQLLKALPPADQFVLSGEQARILRTLEVLERIGTPPAGRVLESLAAGGPGMSLRQEAKASLERLAKRHAFAR